MDTSTYQNNIQHKILEKKVNSHSKADEFIKHAEHLDGRLQKRLTKEINILFTDITGSTTFFKTHGDISGRLMLQRHYDMLSPIINYYEGTIVKIMGDSIMAIFYDSYKAVKAAIQMQRKLSEYNVNLPWNELIRIRIGINFGKGIIEDNDVYGNVVNEASKLISIGQPEQILVSESIYEKIQPMKDIISSPLKNDRSSNGNLKHKIHIVRWHNANQIRDKKLTVVSLAIISRTLFIKEEEGKSPSYFSPIEDVIRDKAFSITVDPGWRLQAIFETTEIAVETALEIYKILQKSDQEFHVGIHTGPVLIAEVEIHRGAEANEAREKAGINEICITHPVYELIKNYPFLKFLPLPIHLKNGISLYKIIR
jgi:class 3 adenylate cyclase